MNSFHVLTHLDPITANWIMAKVLIAKSREMTRASFMMQLYEHVGDCPIRNEVMRTAVKSWDVAPWFSPEDLAKTEFRSRVFNQSDMN